MSQELNIELRHMILAIETAVSLVGMNDTNHGKRIGFIASQIAAQSGLGKAQIQYAFDLGLLHDCGVSSEQVHSNLVNHFDWSDAHIHCEIGYRLLSHFKPLAQFAIPILYHHTPWPQLKTLTLSEQDAQMANLIFLSDRVDVLAAEHYGKDILLERDNILQSIERYAARYFAPELVATFTQLQASEAFWIALEDRHITRYTWEMAHNSPLQALTMHELKQLSLILAYIVDQKSPFTAQHSARVAQLALFLATDYGLSNTQCAKVEIAALLHDLGKLHTPDHILDKPGPLDNAERAVMNQHSYETYEILRHISGMEDIALWASFHHEGLNGAGYPFHLTEHDLSIEARIIAVADVFQALAQHRPYREGLPLDKIMNILQQCVEKQHLAPEVVDLVREKQNECYAIAQGRQPLDNDVLDWFEQIHNPDRTSLHR